MKLLCRGCGRQTTHRILPDMRRIFCVKCGYRNYEIVPLAETRLVESDAL